jgi:nitronate monooxygenase
MIRHLGHSYSAQWAGQGAARARALPAAELMACLRMKLEKAFSDQLTK